MSFSTTSSYWHPVDRHANVENPEWSINSLVLLDEYRHQWKGETGRSRQSSSLNSTDLTIATLG